LIIPQRKTPFFRALHGRVAMAGVGAPWEAMGELAGEGREGEGGRKEREEREKEKKWKIF
jgi:hypothetical protein